MRRKRTRLSEIAMVTLALLTGLGLMGIGYAGWSDTVTIQGNVHTGTTGIGLIPGSCDPASGITWISCNPTGNFLEVKVWNAQLNTNYYCSFDIKNTGTIPIKIQSIVISPLPPAPGVATELTGVAKGDQIEPAASIPATVHVKLVDGTSQNTNIPFTVTFSIVAWNKYVP